MNTTIFVLAVAEFIIFFYQAVHYIENNEISKFFQYASVVVHLTLLVLIVIKFFP